MLAIAFKVLVALATAVLGGWKLGSDRPELSEREFVLRLVTLQVLTAVAFFMALYVIGRQQVTSDVPIYYIPAARHVLAGQVPFRDFTLSYAPLFPYIGAALLSLWSSGKAFTLFAIVLNALTLVLWHSTALAGFGRKLARESSVLYATSGHLVMQTLLGTSQIWIAAALAASALLLTRGRSIESGLVQGVAVCTTKFLALLFWPVLWIFAPRRVRWLAGALLLSIAVYASFVAGGADVLDPLRRQDGLISSGNLPYLLGSLFSSEPQLAGLVADVFALAALAATVAWLYVRVGQLSAPDRMRLLPVSIALVGFVFMLVSKKSYTVYAVFFMYPAILVLSTRLANLRARMAFVLAFNVLLVAEPSLWFHLGGNALPLGVWLHRSGGAAASVFILIDLALVSCYLYLAVISVRHIQRARIVHMDAPASVVEQSLSAL